MDACVCLSQKQLVINIFLALCIKLHLFLWQIFLYRDTYRTLTRKTATEHGENGISRPWKSIKERDSISAKAVIYVSKKELYMIINRCSKWHFHGKLIEIYGVQRKKCSSCHVFMWHVACNIGWVTWQIETIFIKMDYQQKLAVFLKKKCLRYLLWNVHVRMNSFNPQIKLLMHKLFFTHLRFEESFSCTSENLRYEHSIIYLLILCTSIYAHLWHGFLEQLPSMINRNM